MLVLPHDCCSPNYGEGYLTLMQAIAVSDYYDMSHGRRGSGPA